MFAGGQDNAYQSGAQPVLAVAMMRFSAGFSITGGYTFPFSVLQFSHVRKLVQITNQQSYIPTNRPPGLALMLLRLYPSVAAARLHSGFFPFLCQLSPSPLVSVTFIQIKLREHKGKRMHFKRLVLLC